MDNNEKSSGVSPIKRYIASVKEYIPRATLISFCAAIASLVALFVIKSNKEIAEFFNRTTGRGIRYVLTWIFNIFNFSFIETLLLISPVLVAVIIGVMISKGKRSAVLAVRFFCGLLAVVFVIFSVFVFGYEPSYYGYGIDENTGVVRKDLSSYELYAAASILLERAEAELDNVGYDFSGSSVMPYTFSELNEKLNTAAKAFCEKYPAYQSMYSRIKPVVLSEPWTYTHISGLYSFFTGEANINVNYPDFIVVSSAAHEMAHQRGIGKEDEADFAAFLICIESDDAYIRYCGYMELYRTVRSSLYSADKDAWAELLSHEDKRIKQEINAFAVFFEKYRENIAATVNNKVNNAYITSHNQPAGIKSYGLVVDLACNYLLYTE